MTKKEDKIKIINLYYEESKGKGCIEINSDDYDLFYLNSCGHHGMQCKFLGGTEDYNNVMECCDNIADNIHKLEKICNKNIDNDKPKIYKFHEILNKKYVNKEFKFTCYDETYKCKVREIITDESVNYDIELINAMDLGTHFYLSQIAKLMFEEV